MENEVERGEDEERRAARRGKAIGERTGGVGEKKKKKGRNGGRRWVRPKKTRESISASPVKIRYRESRSLRERARVPK